VFESRVLRRTFGSKKIEPTEGWRKLHNVELHDSYSSPRKVRMLNSRRMNCARNVSKNGGKEEGLYIIVAKDKRKGTARKDVSGWLILRWIS
jgi:hypothetical protein